MGKGSSRKQKEAREGLIGPGVNKGKYWRLRLACGRLAERPFLKAICRR